MPREIILIRHGESQHHAQGLTGGWTDTPLTTKGEREAECAARALTALPPVSAIELISSDLIRARQTADIIAARLENIIPTYHQGLRELGNGIARNKTRAEAKKSPCPSPNRCMTGFPTRKPKAGGPCSSESPAS